MPPLVLLSACALKFDATNASISCNQDTDCPTQHHCTGGLCVSDDSQPATVTIGAVAQAVQTVTVPLTVVDPQNSDVTLLASINGAAVVLTPSVAQGSSAGAQTMVTFEVAAVFGDTRYHDNIVLTVQPRTSAGLGVAVQSAPFAAGDDAPQLTDVQLDAVVGGQVTIHFRATDEDLVTVSNLTIGDAPVTLTDNTQFIADGRDNTVTWDASAVPDGSYTLAFSVTDSFGMPSNVVTTPSFELDNRPALTVTHTPFGQRDVTAVHFSYATSAPDGGPVTIGLQGSGTLSVGTSTLTWTPPDTTYHAGVQLTFSRRPTKTATCAACKCRRSTTATTPVTTVSTPDATTQGEVPLQYYVQDSAADNVSIEAQYAPSGASGFLDATLGQGTATDLPSSIIAPGRAGVFVWNSRADIGNVALSDVAFRLRACDLPDGITSACGDYATVTLPNVRNQSPPTLSNLTIVRSATQSGQGPFEVSFEVDDFEDDVVDVRFSFSIDFGVTWSRLPEFPGDGERRPARASLEHRAPRVFDPTGLLPRSFPAVRACKWKRPTGQNPPSSLVTTYALPFADLGPPDAFDPLVTLSGGPTTAARFRSKAVSSLVTFTPTLPSPPERTSSFSPITALAPSRTNPPTLSQPPPRARSPWAIGTTTATWTRPPAPTTASCTRYSMTAAARSAPSRPSSPPTARSKARRWTATSILT